MPRKPSTAAQDSKILEEVNRLTELLENEGIDETRLNAAKELIERAAFMTVTLEILEADIKAKGPVVLFKNGKQEMHVENPSQKSYNTMINRYTATYKEIMNLLPKDKKQTDEEDDEFEKF